MSAHQAKAGSAADAGRAADEEVFAGAPAPPAPKESGPPVEWMGAAPAARCSANGGHWAGAGDARVPSGGCTSPAAHAKAGRPRTHTGDITDNHLRKKLGCANYASARAAGLRAVAGQPARVLVLLSVRLCHGQARPRAAARHRPPSRPIANMQPTPNNVPMVGS